MKNILLIIGIIVLLVSCGKSEIKDPNFVSWEEAVEILNSGDVQTVFQTHGLSVSLHLKNGTKYNTKEPSIDMIIDEVEKCGEKCENIGVATE